MKSTLGSQFRALVIPSILLAFLIASTSLFASFEPLPVGGRAAGMGEAYSAIADDVYALYYNPAGVLQINRPEFSSYYSQLFVGLTDNSQIGRMYFAYGQPLGRDGRLGGIGGSYLTLNLPGLYKEEAIGLTYGREYRRLLNWGVTAKMLRKQIGSDDFTSNAINPLTGGSTGSPDPLLAKADSASALGLDVGLQYRLSRTYAVGLAARNINNPDLALGSQKDSAPSVVSAALAKRLRNGSLDLEIANWKTVENNLRLSLGGEHWFKNGFALRAGGGFGSRSYATASFGASYKMQLIQIDYATVLPLQGVKGTLGMQQVSLTVRFGKEAADPIEQQLLREKEERIKAETEARYAKAELDRLRAQLYQLTEIKVQTQRDEEKRAAEKALEEAKNQEVLAEKAKSNVKDRTTLNKYTAALADYNKKVSQGISLAEQKSLLEKIQSEFERANIDISTVERELKNLKAEEAKAKKDFDLSMSFYRRLVQQGASLDERRSMLERIIQKYKGAGVNISAAEDEMKLLK